MIAIFHRSPARDANRANNALADDGRAERWRSVRDAAWAVFDPLLPHRGARVAIVGAGNAHDVPLTRLAARAAHVDLIDFDAAVARAAAAREPAELAARIGVVECDVTRGAADDVVRAARYGHAAPVPTDDGAAGAQPLGTGGYDLVVGDLLYSQLLFPGLKRLGVDADAVTRVLAASGPPLTQALVRRLHASVAQGGSVVHLHDIACWSDTSKQPLSLGEVLERPEELAPQLGQPTGCDPEHALAAAGARVVSRSWWRWPYARSASYLVRATVAR